MEKEGLESLLKSAPLLPEFQEDLEKLIKEALVHVKGTLVLVTEVDAIYDEAKMLSGNQGENESGEQFKERVRKLMVCTGECMDMSGKFKEQQKITKQACVALNEYSKTMVELTREMNPRGIRASIPDVGIPRAGMPRGGRE